MTIHVPECLKPYAANPAWVAWSLTGADRRKVPFSPLTGKAASSTAPDTWAPLDAALRMTRAARFQPPQGGIGLVSTAVPDLVFLDLDRCLNPLHPDAARLLEACPTYAEITPSGNGARIIGRASEIIATISRKGTTAGGMAVEIYRAAPRYLTVTGARMPDHPDGLADIGADVLDLLAGFGGGADATATTAPEPRDDAELVRRIATGEGYHAELVALAARYIGRGLSAENAGAILVGLMLAAPAQARDMRWQERFDSLPKIVGTAARKYAAAADARRALAAMIGRRLAQAVDPGDTLAEAMAEAAALGIEAATVERIFTWCAKREMGKGAGA
jgi:hypothetical protein